MGVAVSLIKEISVDVSKLNLFELIDSTLVKKKNAIYWGLSEMSLYDDVEEILVWVYYELGNPVLKAGTQVYVCCNSVSY